jgi:hypothetical protein
MTKLLGISTLFALAAALVVGGCSGGSSSPGALLQPQAISHAHPDNQNYNGPPEMANWWMYAPPTAPPSNFEVSLLGDWSGEIGSPQADPSTDAFCGGSNDCTPTVSVVNGNTTVSWSGTTLYENSQNGGYHFGLIGEASVNTVAGCQAMEQCLYAAHWSYPSIPPISWTTVEVAWPHHIHKHFKVWEYAEVYIEVALKKRGPSVYGLWADVPYSPDGSSQPKITFINPGTQKLYVVNSGIIPAQPPSSDPDCVKDPYCKDDLALLDALNYTGAPPPGFPGSRFIPLTNPPTVLKPAK